MVKSAQCSVQLNDLLIEFFTNQKKLLNIPYFEKMPNNTSDCCVLHNHSYTEVFACGSGEILLKSPQSLFALKSGDIAVIPAGVMHTKLNTEGKDGNWVSAGVLCTECKTANETGLFDSVTSLIYGDDIVVIHSEHDYFGIMSDAIRRVGDLVPLSAKLKLATAFCELAVNRNISSDGSSRHNRISKADIDRLMRLDTLLNLKYTTNVTNKQFADELFLGERQLSRFVNRYYGISLHSLIINKRISAAAAMLTQTADTIEQIAAAVGFNGKTSFYREFQKAYGKTPLQFRKEYEENQTPT